VSLLDLLSVGTGEEDEKTREYRGQLRSSSHREARRVKPKEVSSRVEKNVVERGSSDSVRLRRGSVDSIRSVGSVDSVDLGSSVLLLVLGSVRLVGLVDGVNVGGDRKRSIDDRLYDKEENKEESNGTDISFCW